MWYVPDWHAKADVSWIEQWLQQEQLPAERDDASSNGQYACAIKALLLVISLGSAETRKSK